MCYLMVQCVLALLARHADRNMAAHDLAVDAMAMRKAYYDSLKAIEEEGGGINVDLSD